MAYVLKAQKPNDPLDVVGGALTPNEKKLIRQYLEALKNLNLEVNDPDVIKRIMAQVRAGNPLSAANQVPWGNFTQLLEPIVTTMAVQVAMSATLNLKKLPSKIKYEAAFNLTDPRAIGWAQVRAGSTIRQVNEYSRQAVSKIIQDGLRSKLDPDQVEAAIKRVVGLDSRQATALENFYKKTIEDGTLKGLSYQNAVARAETLGQRYRNTLWNQRAERIARTELAEAANQGRFMSWMEADAQGLIPPNSKKRWMIAKDERTCSICIPLNGEIVGWEDNFSIDKLMPTAHPNCRCTAVLIPGEPSAVIQEKIPPTGEYEGYNLQQPLNSTSTSRGQSDVAANNLRDSARVSEPKITRDMIDLSKTHGGEMVGLEYRIKSQKSLSEKIQTQARDHSVTVAAESKNIKDAIRYTITKNEFGYTDMVNNTIDDLRTQGYQVHVVNNWRANSPYKGVNAQITSPTGQMFELQFHTPASLESKNKTHDIYKSLRNTNDPVVMTQAEKDMIEIAKSVPFPRGNYGSLGEPILTIQKHAPGSHDQKTHGGGGSGSKTYSNLGDWQEDVEPKTDEEEELLKYRWNTIVQSQKGTAGKEVIQKYTASGAESNKYLRANIPMKSVDNDAKQLDSVIDLAPRTGGFTVYRGVKTIEGSGAENVFEQLNEGDVFQDRGFVSTTLDPMVALQMSGQSGLMFKITVPPKSAGVFPNSFLGSDKTTNMFAHEVEFLMPRMTKLEVLSREGRVWEMKVVNE